MFQNFTLPRRRLPVVMLMALLILQLIAPAISPGNKLSAMPQDDALQEAENYYIHRQFDASLQILRVYLKSSGLNVEQKEKALILLAKNFIGRGEPQRAKEVIRKILSINPNYRPTINEEKPAYLTIVDEVRKQMPAPKANAEPKSGSGTRWMLAGGGVTAAILIGVLLGNRSGSAKKSNLPLPPEFPENGK